MRIRRVEERADDAQHPKDGKYTAQGGNYTGFAEFTGDLSLSKTPTGPICGRNGLPEQEVTGARTDTRNGRLI
jgi:hypothetical protein